MTPTRFRRRRVLPLAVASISVALVAGAGAAPAFAADEAPPVPLCPPVQQTIGTHVNERLYDPDAFPRTFTSSVSTGSLPDGASLFDGGWYSEYRVVPTTAGAYDFTLTLTSERGVTSQVACHVDVYDDELHLAGRLTTSRIAAPDRYEEAVAISRVVSGAGADTVYIASGEVFADALSASAIAAQRGAPLLLTHSNSVPPAVEAELVRLKPKRVVILGGTTTIEPSVEARLAAFAPKVTRISGADRFEASRNIILGDAPASKTLYVASGNVFPDALSAAPAGGSVGAPVLLVDGLATDLTPDESGLMTARGVTRTIIVGGPSTVSDSMEASVRSQVSQVKRIEGRDRYDASAAVARDAFPTSGSKKPDTVYFATGERYPDALAGAVLATKTGSPIYLVHSDCIPRDAARHILDIGATKAVLLGGSESLTSDVMALKVCSK
ncbi:cell wall-binding repeat-containing protein [Herbiconiux sp. KACC 21604]|uniref:cell wall-binding repeat-containing protein n=1 Tax=unclassified Herbiconiux TaxID=2618217 RepID=UPI00149133B3|nr:cell wall-binding repeat-containing protein [Herbiconiux sp. SALV-R1]QJU53648.1 hypothetical protein HL652_08390 [Herbiconiux sp. SALV-R1]WPO88633.1 cell wall-binding repeat-containing protein [Herbiconiux sp. KACC 21604]